MAKKDNFRPMTCVCFIGPSWYCRIQLIRSLWTLFIQTMTVKSVVHSIIWHKRSRQLFLIHSSHNYCQYNYKLSCSVLFIAFTANSFNAVHDSSFLFILIHRGSTRVHLFCIKLGHNKPRKVTESDFWGKIWKWPFWTKNSEKMSKNGEKRKILF